MKLAVFGLPVMHSLSPAMHRAAMDAVGISGEYEAREVDHAGFLAGVAEMRDRTLDGANVTMPYKLVAFEVCDEVKPRALQVGAANTLFISDDGLVGDNTDIPGVRAAWRRCGLPEDGPVIVLGSGGAAAAALVALRGREQYVVARRPDVAAAVVSRIGTEAAVLEWGEAIPSGVLVNATSIGMAGEVLPDFLLDSATGLFDMPYGNEPTRSVVAMQERHLPVADGLEMLVGQAVESFEIWTGFDVESAILRDAAERELARRAG